MSALDNVRQLTRHAEYYIPSADLSIIVEEVQFRVHRYFFERESTFFSTRVETPTSPGFKLAGSDDSTAIILDNLSAAEFAKFLWVFYNKTYSLYDAPVEDWEIILALSNHWSFPGVKALAIRELEKKAMSDVKRIKLYTENHVDRNYLIPCYAALCEREEPLTAEEGVDLGMLDVIQIAAAREKVRSSRLPSGARSPLSPTIHGADLHEVIRQTFHIVPLETSLLGDQTTHTNITGALETQTTQPPTRKTQSTQKQKQGTKKQTVTKTAQPSTPATPQKPVATPTPIKATQVLPPPAKEATTQTTATPTPVLAKEQKGEATTTTTATKTKTSEVEDDVTGQQQKTEGVPDTASNGDAPPSASPLIEVDSTAPNADSTTLQPLDDAPPLDDPIGKLFSSSPVSFSLYSSFTSGQQSSSNSSGGGFGWAKENLL